jgi:integration host factor subunit beta
MEISGTLTKVNLSRHLMDAMGFTKKDADILVNTFLNSIVSALRAGDSVELRGFGSFRLRERKPRMGRNPRSGQSIAVPSKRIVFFKLGKDLRAKLVDRAAKAEE